MAIPNVFVSSTCYDLGEVRDSLFSFIESYSFKPMLSDKGDIFFHPDLHTHESCIKEIENCHLFVLIIGGRFGGQYKFDTKKSIVNAEYESAKRLNIPVFCFIKKDVFDDHKLFEKNKTKKAIDEIDFPSIEKKEYARNIFEFINDVRLSNVNNGVFPFEFAKDIKDNLGKQWAGLIYDFLLKRKLEKEQEKTNRLLDNLDLIARKSEELIENIYKKLDNTGNAEEVIENLDKATEAAKFFKEVTRYFNVKQFNHKALDKFLNYSGSNLWEYFLINDPQFIIIKSAFAEEGDKKRYTDIILANDRFIDIKGNMTNLEKEKYKKLQRYFDYFLQLTKDQRAKILKDYFEQP